jgi:DedD protein
MPDQQAELRRKARRRLIGAIILVLLLVIFLPMVLDHEPKPIGSDVPIRMPESERAAAAPAPAPPTQNAQAEAPTGAPVDTPAQPPEPSAPAQTTATQPAAEQAQPPSATVQSTAAAVAASSSNAAEAGGGFVVQVGAFSNAGKAAQAQRKVAAAGLPVFTETVAVGGQSRIRVRAGPFEQRAEAEAALEKLSDIGFGGKLMMK